MSKWAQDFAQPKWKVTQVTCYTLKPLMLETHWKQLNLYISLQSFLGPFKMTKLSWKVIKIKMIVAKLLNASQIFINLPSLTIFMPYVSQISLSVSHMFHMFHMFHSPQFTLCHVEFHWRSWRLLATARPETSPREEMTRKGNDGQDRQKLPCFASLQNSRCLEMLFFCRNMEKWCFCCCYMFFYRSLPFLAREMGWVADLDGAGVGHQIDLLRSSHVVSSAPLQKRHIMTNIEKKTCI